MTDRPILFSGAMIRALLDGSKTQTRRVLKPQPEPWRDFHLEGGCQQADWKFETGKRTEDGETFDFGLWMHSTFHESRFQKIPYAVGDRLWVREKFRGPYPYEYRKYPLKDWGNKALWYVADGTLLFEFEKKFWPKARPSIHMPRWASRITLTVKDVRVQRVQEISVADCIAEGIDHDADEEELAMIQHMPSGEYGDDRHKETYADLWDSLNAKRGFGWDENPWVAAYSFSVHKGNIDMEKEG